NESVYDYQKRKLLPIFFQSEFDVFCHLFLLQNSFLKILVSVTIVTLENHNFISCRYFLVQLCHCADFSLLHKFNILTRASKQVPQSKSRVSFLLIA
ncbi:MAG: hypothetical protein ACOC10_06875, partial [Bacteroidota bacterium]